MGIGGKEILHSGKKRAKAGGSKKAGLTFPVPRVGRYMKAGRFAPRVGKNAPIFMAAVLEYIVAELLELAGNAARGEKKNRIKPRHLQLAISDDEELKKLLGNVTISGGGVTPGIHDFLNQAGKTKKGEKGKKGAKAKKAMPIAE